MSITQDGNHCFTASFEVVDVAIWSYLRRHEHYPSTFSRQVKQEGAFVIYHLFPGEAQDARKGYLGALELQKTLEGAVIECAAPVVPEREQTEAEYEAERGAFAAAVTRHKPNNFNFDDVEQRSELEQAIARDVKYQAVKLRIMEQINAEALERLRQYELMRSEILEGLQAFLADRGILPAGEVVQPGGVAGEDKAGYSKLERAMLFKRIKDENPQLSYQGVATRANRDHRSELDKEATAHDVRNDYRKMGWEWERGPKIR